MGAVTAGAVGFPPVEPLHRETHPVILVAHFTIPDNPVPKGRARTDPRTSRHYTPLETRAAEERVVWALRAAGGGRGPCDPTSLFGAHVVFRCATHRHADGDNMLKLLLDALNGVVWRDDSQVVEKSVVVHRGVGATQAHTEAVIYRIERCGE